MSARLKGRVFEMPRDSSPFKMLFGCDHSEFEHSELGVPMYQSYHQDVCALFSPQGLRCGSCFKC